MQLLPTSWYPEKLEMHIAHVFPCLTTFLAAQKQSVGCSIFPAQPRRMLLSFATAKYPPQKPSITITILA